MIYFIEKNIVAKSLPRPFAMKNKHIIKARRSGIGVRDLPGHGEPRPGSHHVVVGPRIVLGNRHRVGVDGGRPGWEGHGRRQGIIGVLAATMSIF